MQRADAPETSQAAKIKALVRGRRMGGEALDRGGGGGFGVGRGGLMGARGAQGGARLRAAAPGRGRAPQY